MGGRFIYSSICWIQNKTKEQHGLAYLILWCDWHIVHTTKPQTVMAFRIKSQVFICVYAQNVCGRGVFFPSTPRTLLECEMAKRSLADTTSETDMNMETRMNINTYAPKHSLTRLQTGMELFNTPHSPDWSAQNPDFNSIWHLWDELKQQLQTRPCRATSVLDLTHAFVSE